METVRIGVSRRGREDWRGGEVAFDFQRSGDRGDGTVMLPELHGVHLTRQ